MKYNKLLVTNIKKLLKETNTTYEQLSKTADVSLTTISLLLTNKYNPSVEILQKIADALDVPLFTLFLPETFPEEPISYQPKNDRNPIVVVQLPPAKAYIARQWHKQK